MIKEGQKIYLRSTSIRQGDDISLKQITVKKVGKKYFTVEPEWYGRFEIKTLIHDGGNYSPSYQVYLSIDDYNLQNEKIELTKKLREVFGGYGKLPFSLEQLKQILKITNSK